VTARAGMATLGPGCSPPRRLEAYMPGRNSIGRDLSIGAPATFADHVRPDVARANRQTFIGAICFLIGAVLLLPERTEETRAS
jgi:hypothetical protein